MAFIPARSAKSRKKSELERALEYSEFGLKGRSSELPEHYDPIRDEVDEEETTAAIEAMYSFGKQRDKNRDQKGSLKIQRKPIPRRGYF